MNATTTPRLAADLALARWLTQPDALFRRAGFALMHSELLFEAERRVAAAALHDLAPSDDDVAAIEAAFARTAYLALGVCP